jgi:DNA-nicking Smr family endonuclease
MTGPQDDIGDEDAAVWKRLTREVKPYQRDPLPAVARPSAPQPRPKRKPSARSTGPAIRLGQGPAPKRAPDPVDLRRGDHAGIDRSTRRRLAQGQLPIEARLDLHGMTAAQAERQLSRFITRAVGDGRRCVLVITGKGANNNGVLKHLVPMWLTSPPLGAGVLALSQAVPTDGGDGALYVMLRRRRQPG